MWLGYTLLCRDIELACDALSGGGVQIGGQVNAGPEQPEDEGGVQLVTFPDIPADPARHAQAEPQADVAVEGVDAHDPHARQPQDRGDHIPVLDPVHGGLELNGQRCLVDGIGDDVQGRRLGEFAVVGFQLQVALGDDLPGGDQAQPAFDGHRAQEPDGHQCPEGAVQSLWGFFQHQPEDRHRQHHPAGRDAQVQNFGEGHGSHLLLIVVQKFSNFLKVCTAQVALFCKGGDEGWQAAAAIVLEKPAALAGLKFLPGQ